MLAKALAHQFEAKLLMLDVLDFSLKVIVLDVIISYCQILLNLYTNIFSSSYYLVHHRQMQSKYGSAKKEPVSTVFIILRGRTCFIFTVHLYQVI